MYWTMSARSTKASSMAPVILEVVKISSLVGGADVLDNVCSVNKGIVDGPGYIGSCQDQQPGWGGRCTGQCLLGQQRHRRWPRLYWKLSRSAAWLGGPMYWTMSARSTKASSMAPVILEVV